MQRKNGLCGAFVLFCVLIETGFTTAISADEVPGQGFGEGNFVRNSVDETFDLRREDYALPPAKNKSDSKNKKNKHSKKKKSRRSRKK